MPYLWLIICASGLSFVNADIGYFWHVTDFHWDHTYTGSDLSCTNPVNGHGIFGDYWCDAPWLLVNDSVAAMKSLKSEVDFILWTGDNTPHASDDNVTFDIHDAILGNITDLLKTVFPSTKVYATLGNHDYYPHNQFPSHGNALYNKSFERWKSWIGEDTAETFRKGAYYTTKTGFGLRIIGLNTNLYYTSNKQVDNIADPSDQLVWLVSTLQVARTANEKVLITAHISPGIIPTGETPWMYERFNNRLNDIIMSFTDIIVGMHFGHEHSDNFRVYHNGTGLGVVAQFCAPSVTPWKYRHEHNPSIRLLKYNRTTSALLDYTQYYMDLPEGNQNHVSNWKVEYSATSTYNLTDLSPMSLSNLITRMRKGNGNEFKSFYKFWTVSVDAKYQQNCDDKCHAGFYCNFRYLSTETFKDCLTDLLPTSIAPHTGSFSRSVSALVGFYIFFIFY